MCDGRTSCTWKLNAPKGKSTWRLLGVATADFQESVSQSRKVTVPDI